MQEANKKKAIVLFFSRLGWALFGVSVVVSGFEFGIEYSTGRGNLRQAALNVLKGFMAVSLFTVLPIRLYLRPTSSVRDGRSGYCYTVVVQGQEKFLLFERTDPRIASKFGRWFVETAASV